MDLLGSYFAFDATRRHMYSALPDAPVLPVRAPGRVRRTTASTLHRVADRLVRH